MATSNTENCDDGEASWTSGLYQRLQVHSDFRNYKVNVPFFFSKSFSMTKKCIRPEREKVRLKDKNTSLSDAENPHARKMSILNG